MPDVTGMSFPGLAGICRVEASITRGVTPGVIVVLANPQDGLELDPGDLVLTCGGQTQTFPDCLPLSASVRKVKLNGGWFWALSLLDHRWRWLNGAISGEYNRRLPDGSIDEDTRKSPSELAELCLDEMDEVGYDVSEMPGSVFPYVNWQDTNPSLALAQVCEAVACEICGGEIGQVSILPPGSGADMPTGAVPLHAPFRMERANRPNRLIVEGGAKVYCHKLKLAAVGSESDGTTKKINDLSYKPSGGWSAELPGYFGGLSTTNQVLAQNSVWRWYDVTGQSSGTLPVPGSSVNVTSIKQYVFLDTRLDQDTDLSSVKRPLPPKVTGTFWDYADVPTDVSADTLYQGGFAWDASRGRVTFPLPVFSMNSSQQPQEPTLNVVVSYNVKDSDGNLERVRRTDQIGGEAGDYVIRRPELFDTNNQGTAQNYGSDEAQQYLSIFAHKWDDNLLQDQRYSGLVPVLPSGIIAQVTFAGETLGGEWSTRVCRLEETDPCTPSEAERRRREFIRLVQEERGA